MIDFYVYEKIDEENVKQLIFVNDIKAFQKKIYDRKTMKFTGAMIQLEDQENYEEAVEKAKKVYFHPTTSEGELIVVENPIKSKGEERQEIFVKALHLFLCSRAIEENTQTGEDTLKAFLRLKKEVVTEISKATYQDIGEFLGNSDLFG